MENKLKGAGIPHQGHLVPIASDGVWLGVRREAGRVLPSARWPVYGHAQLVHLAPVVCGGRGLDCQSAP
jgi:hypothetical protein